MAWLGTYKYRRKVTVSNTNIDSDLTQFPLLLTLSTTAGTGSDDLTSIFTEISDANKLKIAITKTDGTTEIYGEIEKWDATNKKAIIWVSSSGLVLSSTGTTDVYFYYDSTQADNTTYIGATNSTPAESVWDTNYKVVYHLEGLIDSTANNNDLTNTGASTFIAGKIGNSVNLVRASNQYLSIASLTGLPTGSTARTISFWINYDILPSSAEQFGIISYGGLNTRLLFEGGNDFGTTPSNGWRLATYADDLVLSSAPSIATWYLVTLTYDGNLTTGISINGATETTRTLAATLNTSTSTFYIGTSILGTATNNLDGQIDEVKISAVKRSAAWIKANYYSQTDGLVSWGAETTEPSGNSILFGINF